MRVHILDDWFDTLRTLPSFSKLEGHEVTVHAKHEPDPARLAALLEGAEAVTLFRERTPVGDALLSRLPSLRLISQRSVYPHVDVEACTRRGVTLCSNMHSGTPSYAAAELALGLILASFRQIPQQQASLRAGGWQMGVGRTLRGRTLGLYGYGRIGRAVAGYAEALGMKIVWWGSEEGRARAIADGEAVPQSRQAFFSGCDVISLHVRLKPATHGLITAADLAAMRARALLVNTSRSGLIEPGALQAEIARGRIHAAVDVFEEEPFRDTDSVLLTHPNVLATPHVGYVTEDELDLQFADIYDQINAFAAGVPIHVVNPDAADPERGAPTGHP